MEPQKLLALDKRVVTAVRAIGLLASLLLAILCGLIAQHIFQPAESYYAWACWPLAGLLAVVGVVQALWNPYTIRKADAYAGIYIVLGALLCLLVIGYYDLSFLSWLLLFTCVGVYLRLRYMVGAYLLMVLTLGAWIALHPDLQHFSSILSLAGSALMVGITVYVIFMIRRLTAGMASNLATTHNQSDFEHAQLTSLVNSMTDGVIALDSSAQVVLYNAAALDVLDLNSSMQGRSIGNFLQPVTEENATIDIVNFIQNTKTPTINRDLRIKYSDGSFANLYLAVSPVHLGYGQQGAPGFVLLLRDITREKSLEEERDEFISVVSHELRTPIAISEGNVSNAQVIVEKSGDTEAVKKALEEAHNQILFLSDMINDLATLSRAERGKLTLELEDIDVKTFMQELTSNYHADAEKKGLQLNSQIPEQLGRLHSSKLYVREVLQNFITNAIKYTDEGSVTISAEQQEKGVLFKVSDTGIGISKADQERVFDKFFRSEDFRTRKNNGTGLGLYVTMKLARLIHADINLASELNKGSVFSIFIPDLAE